MGQIDALRMVEHVRERLVDLAVAENHIRNRNISDVCRRVWSEGGSDHGLVSELRVEGAFPGEQTQDSLGSLAAEGILPENLYRHIITRDVFPAERLLYNHQSEAIRIAADRKSNGKSTIVMTAGTGLGKTEAFMLPMLSDLWTAPARRENGGMRCLVIYPMNALIADQVERFYGWLQGQSRLTLFHFTSETPEDARAADKRGEPKWGPCRMRTRQEARGREDHSGKRIGAEPFGSVPDIVITNYSMLEYMLCRPQDSRFFGPDLRCIILDEAHLYTGALAAEISMLLRRVRQRCGVASRDVLQITTSATLGGNVEDLREFASALFSTEPSATKVIQGRYAPIDLGERESPPSRCPSASEFAELADVDITTLTANDKLVSNDTDTVGRLADVARLVASRETTDAALKDYPSTPARFLYEVLRKAPLVRQMANILSSEAGYILALDALVSKMFPEAEVEEARKATILLLRLSAAARNRATDMPVVPHRLHLLVRAPEGLSVCLNPECTGPAKFKLSLLGCLQSTNDRCRYCGHLLLPIHRCANCGEWALTGHETRDGAFVEPANYSHAHSAQTYYLLTKPQGQDAAEVIIDPKDGSRHGHGAPGTQLWKAPTAPGNPQIQRCPTCHSEWTPSGDGDDSTSRNRVCQPLHGGRSFALSVIAETILHDLPPFPGPSKYWKPAEGRRLLCFSDSRGAAARLGPRLTRQHEIAVIRSAIARCAQELSSEAVVGDLVEEIETLKRKMREPRQHQEQQVRRQAELERKERELEQARTGVPFELFASMFACREEVRQILHRDLGEKHNAQRYLQRTWEANSKAVRDKAQALVATELDRPLKTQVSVEAVGLVEVAYPGIQDLEIPPRLEAELPSKDVQNAIGKHWPDILHLLLESLRTDLCLGWSLDSVGRKWMGESPLTARWTTRTRNGWQARAFVGATERQLRRRFAANILRAAGCTEADARRLSRPLLEKVFDQLYSADKLSWLERKEHHATGQDEIDRAFRILLDKLSIRRPAQLYRCQKTGTIWTRSALGWAPIDGCLGNLEPIFPKDLDDDPRWGRARRELLKSSIFSMGLWAEEHSAQRSPLENRRLQDLFKAGIRNVLSSTTTMELGIDIGGLNGALLSNVPPGPAHYRQRAGRVGRRSDGSAVVVTFARSSGFDREVFRRFGKYLGRPLRRPVVFLDRKRIVQRHFNALLLSEFLRGKQPGRTGAMHAFGRMGRFCGVFSIPPRWESAASSKPVWAPSNGGDANLFLRFLETLETKPAGYDRQLAELAPGTPLVGIDEPNIWCRFVTDARDAYQRAIGEWRGGMEQLREAWEEIPVEPSSAQRGEAKEKANSIRYQVYALCDITVIAWLADYRFLPRYGFPINLQKLTVRMLRESGRRERSVPDERYRLERSSLLALSEYVPGSQVLVGGKVAVSRGILKHWTGNNLDRALGLEWFALECAQGHTYMNRSHDACCPRCGKSPTKRWKLLFPRFGYTTAAWEPPKRATRFERIGKGVVCPIAFTEKDELEVVRNDFGGVKGLRVTYREEAPFLIRNAGDSGCGFALCTRCGFAMNEAKFGKGRMDLPKGFERHASVYAADVNNFCWKKNEPNPPVLRNRVIAARELTDMLLIEWPGATSHRRDAVYSLGRAFVLAGAHLLELDERELGIETFLLDYPNLGIVIYDTSPGGSGHCAELLRQGRNWLEKARDKLYVNEEHNRRCRRACLDCILDFSGQYRAFQLDRRAALGLMDRAIE